MDRQERPSQGSSRIPSAGSRLSTRTPLTGRTLSSRTPLSASTLGKRPAADAGIGEDPLSSRKALSQSQARLTSSERRVLELQRELRERDAEIEAQRLQIDKLSNERRILLEGETKEKDQGKAREEAWATERNEFVTNINELRRQSRKRANDLESLRSQYDSLTAEHLKVSQRSKSSEDLYERRLKEVEDERDSLRQWQRRAQSLAIELEEEKRRASEGARAKEDEAADRKGDETIRKELRRQSQNLVSLQHNHDALKSEVYELRKFKKEAETNERNAKEAERALRDEVRALHVELERARHEVDSLTQTFPTGSASDEDATTLQNRLSTLSTLHNETKAALSEKSKEVEELHWRLSKLATDSTSATLEATRRAEEAERELRWAKEGRRSAEVREDLTRKELEAMRGGPGGGDTKHLEKLVAEYKQQLDALSRDSREVETRLEHGAGLVKAAELEAAQDRAAQLEQDIAELQETVTQLNAANTTLDAEVSELMRRVASGEYNPTKERCLELGANPAAKLHAVRQAQLDDLRAENAALLDRMGKLDQPGASGVPRESYDRLEKEKNDQQAAHDKRLLRLKEIFGMKSREFLEAVYSLLGWRIKFEENGGELRLQSMYAPKGKMGLTLKFTSHEGHFGTMLMSGAMARGLEEARQFWVVERQSIPGFLAQVTTEMFEKTTIGRAAGYVGLE